MNLPINVMYYVMFYVSVVANGVPNNILNIHTQGSQNRSADLRSDQFDRFDHNEYDYMDRRDLILDQRSHSETLYEYRPRATAVLPLLLWRRKRQRLRNGTAIQYIHLLLKGTSYSLPIDPTGHTISPLSIVTLFQTRPSLRPIEV